MRILRLIHEAKHLIDHAHGCSHRGFQEDAKIFLVELLVLLVMNLDIEATDSKTKQTTQCQKGDGP